MLENNFILKFKAFFESYKGMIAYLGFIAEERDIYRIQVSKQEISDEEVKINLCIYDTRYDRGFNKYFDRDKRTNNLNYFSSNIIVKKEHYEDIISNFIEDFYSNHKVIYSVYYTYEHYLTIHNTNFELRICYNKNEEEIALARKDAINKRINIDSNKKKVLEMK